MPARNLRRVVDAAPPSAASIAWADNGAASSRPAWCPPQPTRRNSSQPLSESTVHGVDLVTQLSHAATVAEGVLGGSSLQSANDADELALGTSCERLGDETTPRLRQQGSMVSFALPGTLQTPSSLVPRSFAFASPVCTPRSRAVAPAGSGGGGGGDGALGGGLQAVPRTWRRDGPRRRPILKKSVVPSPLPYSPRRDDGVSFTSVADLDTAAAAVRQELAAATSCSPVSPAGKRYVQIVLQSTTTTAAAAAAASVASSAGSLASRAGRGLRRCPSVRIAAELLPSYSSEDDEGDELGGDGGGGGGGGSAATNTAAAAMTVVEQLGAAHSQHAAGLDRRRQASERREQQRASNGSAVRRISFCTALSYDPDVPGVSLDPSADGGGGGGAEGCARPCSRIGSRPATQQQQLQQQQQQEQQQLQQQGLNQQQQQGEEEGQEDERSQPQPLRVLHRQSRVHRSSKRRPQLQLQLPLEQEHEQEEDQAQVGQRQWEQWEGEQRPRQESQVPDAKQQQQQQGEGQQRDGHLAVPLSQPKEPEAKSGAFPQRHGSPPRTFAPSQLESRELMRPMATQPLRDQPDLRDPPQPALQQAQQAQRWKEQQQHAQQGPRPNTSPAARPAPPAVTCTRPDAHLPSPRLRRQPPGSTGSRWRRILAVFAHGWSPAAAEPGRATAAAVKPPLPPPGAVVSCGGGVVDESSPFSPTTRLRALDSHLSTRKRVKQRPRPAARLPSSPGCPTKAGGWRLQFKLKWAGAAGAGAAPTSPRGAGSATRGSSMSSSAVSADTELATLLCPTAAAAEEESMAGPSGVSSSTSSSSSSSPPPAPPTPPKPSRGASLLAFFGLKPQTSDGRSPSRDALPVSTLAAAGSAAAGSAAAGSSSCASEDARQRNSCSDGCGCGCIGGECGGSGGGGLRAREIDDAGLMVLTRALTPAASARPGPDAHLTAAPQ
ncbi:hypothetical protein PLESTB_001540000 [Pleodorina starrii]|uniref:Uncharacterized protein n=1 Tax=Pleodorina starrii TaxID=330485 RepID=A0A9W6BXU6_9CHLO|nr:hypothetical protein PLESTM_001932300 [Pleodorina starrii]GLC59827.1 hypothetical protein PLESTB_001540000 [Pleodorina starrii]GLC67291.1 hypothetical protein PLESTF_000539000 [Pleodorina starrii]